MSGWNIDSFPSAEDMLAYLEDDPKVLELKALGITLNGDELPAPPAALDIFNRIAERDLKTNSYAEVEGFGEF